MARQDRASQVDAYRSQIDELLRSSPHITAKRIGTLLRERVGADVKIGERALRRYVAGRRKLLVPKEAFGRAAYAPGAQAPFDFTPVNAIIAGVLVTLQLFVMRFKALDEVDAIGADAPLGEGSEGKLLAEARTFAR